MEKYLDQAGILLQDVVRSRDISTLVVLHRLRDLAMVLDKLKLDDECRLTGDCALDLAEALVRHSPEFKEEQADALVFIAELSVYQLRARALFIQAVSISEEMVENNASHSNPNKCRILEVLGRAGSWALRHPDHQDHQDHNGHLGAQWLERAVQLFTKVLPPITVNTRFISILYSNYGYTFLQREQYSNALEAYYASVSYSRTLVSIDPAAHNDCLARALYGMGTALCEIGKYDDAIVACKEALEICMTMSAQDPLQYNELMANILASYAVTLGRLKRVPEAAAAVAKQAVSLFRNLAQTRNEYRYFLWFSLIAHGNSYGSLGQHAEAVLAYQEAILLGRAFAATDSEQEIWLIVSLHEIAISFYALDKHAEANTAATEALERNRGKVIEGCDYEPDFRACLVCKRGIIPDSLQNDSPFLSGLRRAFSSTNAPSAHNPPINVVHPSGLGQSGVASEAPVPVHLDPMAPSPPYPPSNQSHSQEVTDTSTVTPQPTGATVEVPVRRKKDKFLGLFRGNWSRWKNGLHFPW
jgi:tetratricopeptide (TPR) repeat protein